MDFDSMTDTDRHIVRVALTNHADALLKEAKKLEALGHHGMADKLTLESQAVQERLRPIFDDQRSLGLG